MIEQKLKITLHKEMWHRLLQWVEDNDYCVFCDNHPSHEHSEKCPLNPIGGVEVEIVVAHR